MYARNARHVPLQWRVDNKQGVVTGSANYNLQPYAFAIALHPCDFPAPSPTRSGARQTQRLAATIADQVLNCQICQHAACGSGTHGDAEAGSLRVHTAGEGRNGTSLRGFVPAAPEPRPPLACILGRAATTAVAKRASCQTPQRPSSPPPRPPSPAASTGLQCRASSRHPARARSEGACLRLVLATKCCLSNAS